MVKSTQVFQNMKQFFIKNGKKNIVEKNFYNYIKERGFYQKGNPEFLIEKSFLNATTYIFLKSRRRGKRVNYKISYLEEMRGDNRAMLTFSKLFKENHKKGEAFSKLFEKELINLSSDKNSLITKRDSIHKIALENIPHTWYSEKEETSNTD